MSPARTLAENRFDPVYFPLAEAASAKDLERYPWPRLTGDAHVANVAVFLHSCCGIYELIPGIIVAMYEAVRDAGTYHEGVSS